MTKKFIKLLLSGILLFAFYLLVAKPTSAATDLGKWNKYNCDNGPLTGECLSEHQINNTVFASQDLLYKVPATTEGEPTGALPSATRLIASLYNPPASGVYYAYDILQRFGVAPAYAQGGIGFTGLQPILPIWKGFRNVTYMLFTIFFVVIGIAIMFRIKISPQAVISIENMLPKVIGALIMITFSYAIAGFIIDLTYLLLALVLRVLLSVGFEIPGAFQSFTDLTQASLIDIFQLARHAVPWTTLQALSAIIGGVVLGTLGAFATGAPGLALGATGGAVAGAVLISVIILVFLLFNILKFFFGLINCYINAILLIILSPLQIALGVIPGVSLNFGTWLKTLSANLLVFPITTLFLVIANMLIDASSKGLWAPSLLGPGQEGGIMATVSSLSGGLVPVAIGIGTIMLLAKLPQLIVQAVFMIKPTPWETAIGETVSGIIPASVRQGAGPVVVGAGLGFTESRLKGVSGTKKHKKYLGKTPAEWGNEASKLRELLKGGKLSS